MVRQNLVPHLLRTVGCCMVVMAVWGQTTFAQIGGFTEPFRSIELSSDESGAIASLSVEEGQYVESGSPIARLDTRVQSIQLEIAQHLASANSQLVANRKSAELRRSVAAKLGKLKQQGHASGNELNRAEIELSIAEAKLMASQEEAATRKIEIRRAQAQLDRRTITAPFSGVVAKVHRREGEFLSPLRPEIVTIIQVDKLLARFAIPSSLVGQFSVGNSFELTMDNGTTVAAHVYSVGVETDAQSGTVQVKFVFDNPGFGIRAGEVCTLNI